MPNSKENLSPSHIKENQSTSSEAPINRGCYTIDYTVRNKSPKKRIPLEDLKQDKENK